MNALLIHQLYLVQPNLCSYCGSRLFHSQPILIIYTSTTTSYWIKLRAAAALQPASSNYTTILITKSNASNSHAASHESSLRPPNLCSLMEPATFIFPTFFQRPLYLHAPNLSALHATLADSHFLQISGLLYKLSGNLLLQSPQCFFSLPRPRWSWISPGLTPGFINSTT
jgi:hypothetical protein